jgi:hypothetical protein
MSVTVFLGGVNYNSLDRFNQPVELDRFRSNILYANKKKLLKGLRVSWVRWRSLYLAYFYFLMFLTKYTGFGVELRMDRITEIRNVRQIRRADQRGPSRAG